MSSTHTAEEKEQFRHLLQARLRELAKLSTSLSQELDSNDNDDQVREAARAILNEASGMWSSVREFTQGNESVVPALDLRVGEGSVLLIKQEDDEDNVQTLPTDLGVHSSDLGQGANGAASGPASSHTGHTGRPVYFSRATDLMNPILTQYPIHINGHYPYTVSIPIYARALMPPIGQTVYSRKSFPIGASFNTEQLSAAGVRYILSTTVTGVASVSAQVTAVPPGQ